MIYTYLAAAALTVGGSFYSGWTVNQWKHDSDEKEHLALHAEQAADLHRLEQARSSSVIAAVNLSRPLETKLRAESAALRNDLVGLRNASTAALSYASTSLDTCTRAAATYDQLYLASTRAYSELAETAQRHAIDIKTLTDGWPK